MRILVVAATDMEITSLAARLGDESKSGPRMKTYSHARHDIDVLTTGVGMVATASWCSRALAQTPYDLALNLSVCGSFDSSLELAQVVHVVSDRIAELGAEDGESFLTIQELKLLDDDEFPFKDGRLVNLSPPLSATLEKLTTVNGITVNTMHGNERSIASVRRRFQPQVESMEGAAFMYACMIHGISFGQVRAVSNVVEKRNRKAWNLSGAIRNLMEVGLNILEDV